MHVRVITCCYSLHFTAESHVRNYVNFMSTGYVCLFLYQNNSPLECLSQYQQVLVVCGARFSFPVRAGARHGPGVRSHPARHWCRRVSFCLQHHLQTNKYILNSRTRIDKDNRKNTMFICYVRQIELYQERTKNSLFPMILFQDFVLFLKTTLVSLNLEMLFHSDRLRTNYLFKR